MTQAGKQEERQKLVNLISQWNQDHYDIFELSQPNEELEFHGVVRFYFQDKGEVVTKCIRVSSSASTDEVVSVLVEKFRPDMRMLTNNEYALYEVHVNGEERKLNKEESVLSVQLNWGNDVREGRFLLKREGVPTIAANEKEQQNFKRKLSKREKKEKKKHDKKGKENDSSVAEKLYTDMPESTFTRSISNPEAVMKRRRQQKVEKKLQQCRGQDGHGGTLKIYGETLKPDIPYKTLLLSTTDNVAYVIKEAIEKYGLEKEIVPEDLSLVQVLVPPEVEYHGGTIGEERIMEDHECPLAIAMQHPQNKGTMLFQLKLKSDSRKGKHKKMRSISHDDLRYARDEPPPVQKLPYLIELNPDGSDNPKGKVHRLNLKFTEVGCDRSMYIQILGPNIQPRHCVIGLSHNDGIVTVTPTSPESETYVNNQRVYETTTLQNGMTVRFGKLSIFRFLDPNFEEKMKKGQVPTEEAFQKRGMPPYGAKPQETNFDVDGRVETMDGASSRGSDRGHPQDDVQNSRSPHDQSFGSQPDERMMPPSHQKHIEEALPAALEFRDEKEDAFLSAIILDGNNSAVQFKLSPTYILYMAVRYCLSNAYRPEMTPSDRALRITALVNKIANMSHQAIQTSRDNPAALAFWMANASEILHFYKQDHDVHPFSQDAQEMLAESVQMAFHHLVRCLQYDLQRTMPAFLDENDHAEDSDIGMQDENRARYNRGNKPNLSDVLDTLSSAMNLLRRCRVNAALTIQLFSQLFHFINMWLFNILVANQRPHQFCTRSWGMRLKRRLGRIEAWAEKQGLELAADCHLCRIIQAAHLLQAPKSNPDDIADISSTCFKLNSLQLRELLQRYIPESNEPPIPQNLIESIVGVAENMADELTKTDGREVRLEEDPDLQLPFLLPEDGYSCDTIRGIPNGLGELIEPLARAGLCRMVAQPSSRGDWTVYMSNGDGPRIEEAVRKNQQGPQTPEPRPQPQLPKEPEVVSVTFNKVKGSMGLSIVAAKGDGQKERGIYIKSVVKSGAADIDGRLQAGDQLLEVDGKSLVGLTQEKAAELMTRTGQTVTLKVAKQGAFYHGLATLLSQPSPIMQRASPKKPASPMINKQRPQEEGPPPYNGNMEMDRRHLPGPHPARQAAMQSPHSRSSPSLNKYRKGVTHKDMENIYSRDALWRLVLQAEKNNLVARSFGNHLPESIKSGNADKKVMDDNVRIRSKSVGALDAPKLFNDNVHTNDRNGNIENVPLKHPVAHRPDGYITSQRGVVLQKSNSMGRNGFIDYRKRIQSETDLRNSKIRDNLVDMRDLQAEVRQMKKLQTMDDSRIQYGKEPRGRLRQKRMTQQERRQRSKSTSDLHRMKIGQMNGDAFQGYDVNGGVGENDHNVMQELHNKMQNFLERKKEKQATKIKQLKELVGYRERVPLSPLNDYNQKVQKPLPRSSGYHSLSGTSDMSVSDDVFNNDVVMREKRGRRHGNTSHSEGDRWNLDYDSVFRVRSNGSERSYDNSSMLEMSRRRQKAQHDNRNRAEKSRSFSYGTQSLPRNIENYRKPRGPIPNFHGVQRSLSAHGPPRSYRDNRLVNHYAYRNDSMRDSYSSVSVTSDSYRLSDGYIHSQHAPVGFITRHPRSKSITSLPIRDGTGSDRGRPSASARDLRDHHHSPHMQQSHPDRYQQREMDPKSKSIPNLRMDTSFEHKDPQHNMRPAASVGALQNAGNFHDYYNQRPDPRDLHGNDYENTPNVDPRFNKPHQDMRNDRGYPEGQHMPPGGQFGKSQHPMERGPPSSRTSSASVRDDRPHSAYYPQTQDRPVVRNERPVSMEVNPNRVEDWQHRYGLEDNSFDNRDPNYVNTLPPSQQMQNNGYVNQGDIPKLTANNESRQPNFYENTMARQQEPTPAFHQLRRPQNENEKPRPAVAAKPFVAPKPTTPKVQPADIPRVDVNNKNSQPHFYDPRMQNEQQRSPNSSVPSNYIPGRPLMTHSHSTGFNDPRLNKSVPGGREIYNSHHLSPDLPPPPNEIPPELPPPPSSDDLPEELPPLPPPPTTDYKPMQQAEYVNHPMNPAFGGPHNYQYEQQQRQQQANIHHSPPQTSNALKVQMPQGYHPNNDYQNINYDSRPNRSFESQSQHSPGHVYETYDSKAQTLPTNYQPPMYDSKAQSLPANYQAPPHIQQQLQQNSVQQNRNRLVSEMSELTSKFNKDGKNQSLTSPWDRDEKEKLQKMQEEELSRLREQEINELESRSYLSPQEQDRLRKLRLEQEFQRRVQEVSGKDDDEEDSDTDITNNTQAGREFLIQTIQEDINKAQRRLEELNQRRLYEEYEREKDRMQRLERKLEIFEKEREERQQRLQKRQQKKQREQEEYQRKQRELREKQRAEYEEQKRLHMIEEEKLRQRKLEEQQRQKELERERLQELQAQREAEEAALRAEARRREEEYRRQEMEKQERERREQQREIRVNEERKRLEQLANQNQGYQQYANLPPQNQSHYGMDKGGFAPPPPQRGSSYDVAGNRTSSNMRNNDVMQNNFSGSDGYRGLNAGPDRNGPEISTKKSVSFNTQLETLNRYSVTSEEDRTPHASQSSYRSSHSSTSSEPHSPHSMSNSHPPFGHSGPITPNNVGNDTVFDSTPPQNHVNLDVKYRTAENTPGVIGAQEIYRDPRNRIEAEKLQPKKPGSERMSFRDKMKFFAQESGESTIKNRPKASKALRQIESQLHNGQ